MIDCMEGALILSAIVRMPSAKEKPLLWRQAREAEALHPHSTQ